jgi:hypothetical protein
LSGNSASTNNTTIHVTTPGTYKWFVTWPGNTNNRSVTSNCVESFTIANS